VWGATQFCVGGSKRFFYLSLGNGGLKEYYELNFNLLYHHKIDIKMFDDMIPWEKEIYITMLANKVKEENEKRKLEAAEQQARMRR
jgi:hypothetical protein